MTLVQEMRDFSHSGSRLRKRKARGVKVGVGGKGRKVGLFRGIWEWFTGLFSRGDEKEKLRELQNKYADNRKRLEIVRGKKVVRDKYRVRQHR